MEAGDDEAELGAGFDFCESAAFKEGEIGGGPFGGVFAADEVPIFPADDDGAQNAFGLVVAPAAQRPDPWGDRWGGRRVRCRR